MEKIKIFLGQPDEEAMGGFSPRQNWYDSLRKNYNAWMEKHRNIEILDRKVQFIGESEELCIVIFYREHQTRNKKTFLT